MSAPDVDEARAALAEVIRLAGRARRGERRRRRARPSQSRDRDRGARREPALVGRPRRVGLATRPLRPIGADRALPELPRGRADAGVVSPLPRASAQPRAGLHLPVRRPHERARRDVQRDAGRPGTDQGNRHEHGHLPPQRRARRPVPDARSLGGGAGLGAVLRRRGQGRRELRGQRVPARLGRRHLPLGGRRRAPAARGEEAGAGGDVLGARAGGLRPSADAAKPPRQGGRHARRRACRGPVHARLHLQPARARCGPTWAC